MFFSDDYFNREVICNFEVSEIMKRAWAALIEVLQIVIDVCKKHNLQYFADWGTLLGAVRHNGFIPWDDDIDICFKRDDYNKLISILKDELPKGFAIMGMFADTEEMRLAAEVTHLRVVADDSWNFNDYMGYFHGFPYQRVGIDIFPIDYIPNNTSEAELQKEIVKQGLFVLGQWDNLKKKGELDECLRRYLDMCNIYPKGETDIKNWLWKLVDRICSLYSGYSCAAEPPVQYRLSHLSRRSEPLIKHTICMMRVYSRNALSNPYTSRMEISCSASMLVMLMR